MEFDKMRIPIKLRYGKVIAHVSRWFDDASVTVYDWSEAFGAAILSPIWGGLYGLSMLVTFPRITMKQLPPKQKAMVVYHLKVGRWPETYDELKYGQELIDTNAKL